MILDDLVKATKRRVKAEKLQFPVEEFDLPKTESQFLSRLQAPGFHIIGEVKQASPSKGQIVSDFPYQAIAQEYSQAKVAAISVLTEPDYFKGSIKYLQEIQQVTQVPLLRKDFIVDDYMIYQAKANGASAILLIVAILSDDQLNSFLQLAIDLKLDALVEVHDETEVQRALAAGAKIIGINNRNLQDFSVDFANSLQLRELLPASIVAIAESGVKNRQQIQLLADHHFQAALIGETLMKASDKAGLIRDFTAVANGQS